MDRLRSGLLGDAGASGGATAAPGSAAGAGRGATSTAASGASAASAAGDGRGAADASLLALVDRLTGLLDRSALSELEVGAGGTTLILRKADGAVTHPGIAAGTGRGTHGGPGPGQAAAPAPPAAHATGHAAADAPAGPPTHAVVAPLTGIFYASPSPTAPPFVAVGQEIVAGQVIGLIEAMKLFNEIKSDASGRISKVAVENGKLVKAKQVLIEVVPL